MSGFEHRRMMVRSTLAPVPAISAIDVLDPVPCCAWCVAEHLVRMLEDMPVGIDETEGGVFAHRVRSGAWGTLRQNSGSCP
jgi:hypothetical protein